MKKYLKLFVTVLFTALVVTMVALWQGLDSFVFAWVLNFMLMIVVLFLTETFPPGLKSSYYDIKEWEAKGTIYRMLGVNLFRRLLVFIGWEKLNKAKNPVNKRSSVLNRLEYKTRQSEFGHGIIFLIVMMVTIAVSFQQGVQASFWLLLLNILLNVYPMLVQRYNRPRIQKLIKASTSLQTHHKPA